MLFDLHFARFVVEGAVDQKSPAALMATEHLTQDVHNPRYHFSKGLVTDASVSNEPTMKSRAFCFGGYGCISMLSSLIVSV